MSIYKDGFFTEADTRVERTHGSKKKLSTPHYGPCLSKADAANYLGVSERTIERWVKAKRLRKLRGTSRALFPQSELDRFISTNL